MVNNQLIWIYIIPMRDSEIRRKIMGKIFFKPNCFYVPGQSSGPTIKIFKRSKDRPLPCPAGPAI